MNAHKIFIVLITIVVSSSEAAWTPQMLKLSEAWNSRGVPFSDSSVSTAWGFVKTSWRYSFSDDEIYKNSSSFPIEGYSKNVRVFLSLATNKNFTIKGPLYILLPGIFSGVRESIMAGYYQRLETSNAHILILPNPWSSDALSRRPTTPPGDIVLEAHQTIQLIKKAIHSIGAKNVTSLHILGVSYGGLLAAVTAAQIEELGQVHLASVTLLSPPLKAKEALMRLDQLSAASSDLKCEHKIGAGLELLRAAQQSKLSVSTIECARSLVPASFRQRLESATQYMPADIQRSLAKSNVSFATYLAAYPQLEKVYGGDLGTLKYWVNLIEFHHPGILQIVSATDDFLNDPANWSEVRGILSNPDSELILLNWGGHLGYTGQKDLLFPTSI